MKWIVFLTSVLPTVLDVVAQVATAFLQTKKSDFNRIDK